MKDKKASGDESVAPLYDLTSFQLLVDGDSEKLKNYILVFLESMGKSIEELQESVKQIDSSQIEFSAHKLKGSASLLKATSLADIAFELEEMGKNAVVDGLNEKLEVLLNMYKQVEKGMNKELSLLD